MRRREFIAAVGAAFTWPIAAYAQKADRIRRVGILLPGAADDSTWQTRFGAFQQELALLNWSIGRNLQIDARWASSNATDIRKQALELMAAAPDVLVAAGTSAVVPLKQATRAIPIVFVHVIDPVGGGTVDTLARPGGNATGFTNMEYGLSGKWLELLKEIAPAVTRVAVLRDADQGFATSQFAAIQAVAPSLRVEVKPIDMREPEEIEEAVVAFARIPNSGLIVTASGAGIRYRDLIIQLAAHHKLPAVYFDRVFVGAGGLASYGSDLPEQYRLAARYVDRILKGEKPSEMPVQMPTKYETVLNIKTAKSLGIPLPEPLLSRADAVIE